MEKPDNTFGMVDDVIHWNGIAMRKGSNGRWGLAWTSDQINTLKRLYLDQELSIRDVAAHFDVGHTVIQKKLQELDLTRKAPNRIPGARTPNPEYVWCLKWKAVLDELLSMGFTCTEIAQEVQIKPEHIRKVVEGSGTRHAKKWTESSLKYQASTFMLFPENEDLWIALATRTEFKNYPEYQSVVRSLTKLALSRYGSLFPDLQIRPRGQSRIGCNTLHRDHRFSIHSGYFIPGTITPRPTPVPVIIVAHPVNLEFLPGSNNSSKGSNSSVSLSSLRKEIRQVEKDRKFTMEAVPPSRSYFLRNEMKRLKLEPYNGN